MENLEIAIKKTIDYAKKYGVELSFEELVERLQSDKVFSKEEVWEAVKKKKIRLAARNRNGWTGEKMRKARRLAKKINIADILVLGVTGSVASGYPKEEDDIDVFLIIKKNRLWLTRLKLFWKLRKGKMRRQGQKEEKDQFCFNLWLDEGGLEIPGRKRNLRNGLDAIMLKPIINKNKTYEKFLEKNSWIKSYLATGYENKSEAVEDGVAEEKNRVVAGINLICFVGQWLYMRRKMKKEVVGLRRAFFHPH